MIQPAAMLNMQKAHSPRGLSLSGMRIVVDCAHGAGYRAAPAALWELGAEVISIGVSPQWRQYQ